MVRNQNRVKKPRWRRALTWSLVIVGVILFGLASYDLYGEAHSVDVNIAAYNAQVKAGQASTDDLRAQLATPQAQKFLADPYFTGAQWGQYKTALARKDAADLATLRGQMTNTEKFLTWPFLRDRVTAFAKTMTLSFDTPTRAKLYAVSVLAEVCGHRDPQTLTPMYTLAPAGTLNAVAGIAPRYCA